MLDPSRIKVIIYDCDGVLIDSLESNLAYYNHILAHFALPPVSPEHTEVVHTGTARQVIDALFAGTPHLEAAQQFQVMVPGDMFLHLIRAEPHGSGMCFSDRGQGSDRRGHQPGEESRAGAPRLGLYDLFDVLVSGFDVSPFKAGSGVVDTILEHLDLTPTTRSTSATRGSMKPLRGPPASPSLLQESLAERRLSPDRPSQTPGIAGTCIGLTTGPTASYLGVSSLVLMLRGYRR